MTTLEQVQSALLGRFGLSPRTRWRASLSRAIDDIGSIVNLPSDKLIARAVTDPYLLREIAGRITVPESCLFSHAEQLESVARYIVRRVSETGPNETIRVWSAGCSQGEEPYSLAILLLESLPAEALTRVAIIASDISAGAIAGARDGIYSSWSFRGLSDIRRHAYFEALDDKRYRLISAIRSMVVFCHASIQEQLVTLAPESFDVVMFRNVAIYLADDCLPPLYEKISAVMKTGGWLCLSSSDPPVRQLTLEKVDGSIAALWQKRAPQEACAPLTKLLPPETVSPPRALFPKRPSPPPPTIEQGESGSERPRRGDISAALREELTKVAQGRVADAERVAEELIEKYPQASAGFYLLGQIALANKHPAAAEQAFRMALFVDPEDLLSRFWYAATLAEVGSSRRSHAMMTALAEDLRGLRSGHCLSDGETTAGQLAVTVKSFLQQLE